MGRILGSCIVREMLTHINSDPLQQSVRKGYFTQ